ncbi:MAG TPA: YlxR family protein [Candidatus Binatia bacterium]|jgi:hypothetical protein|nr:YlxR family protein [Candidatus Binatia bacterium]
MRGHVPIRTCVGCGERDAQQVLLRVVSVADRLAPDPRRTVPGRGAYLHRRRGCWEAFVGRRGPVRSLRRSVARAERERLVQVLAAGGPGGAR